MTGSMKRTLRSTLAGVTARQLRLSIVVTFVPFCHHLPWGWSSISGAGKGIWSGACWRMARTQLESMSAQSR